MNKPVKNLSASVHQRLLNKSRETNQPFNELIQYYGIERLLYRLSLSQYSRQFVLKGALMFKAWGMANFRPTRDVDLLGHALNTLEHIKALFEDVCRLEVSPDGLEFDKNVSVGRIKEDSDLWVSTRDHHRGKIPGDDCPRHGKQPHERFFFGDGLTWDDVFNRHGGIIMQNGKTPLSSTTRYASGTMSPKGEKLIPPETKVALLWTITTAITRPAPFPPFDRLRAGLGRARG